LQETEILMIAIISRNKDLFITGFGYN
jgi:hypothetical protein